MYDHGQGPVLMLQGLAQIGVIIFQPVGKCLCEAVYPPRINNVVIGGLEMIPLQTAGILPILIKLAIDSS
jgi:hypothetical protein